ncbi:MAG: 16S rRNA (guanine(527)-N(7))-methyltransferase RsmG [Crocinitomicaceae bacterium]|nr:16S rRNA (guanine(527)-N(7))-methyltransferase RsmG [Crocinitomicaceae bacterium]
MKIILKYFPDLTEDQIQKFFSLIELYSDWNEKINVISRKDLDNFYERHVLHSLGIAKMVDFEPGSDVLDVGTGGGFPGIPLAILFPDVHFVLVDSIAKKMKVVEAVAEALDLKNVEAKTGRAEKVKGKFDFIVSRAVTRMNKFIPWVRHQIKKDNKNSYPNGIFYLKGGELAEELSEIKQDYEIFDLDKVFEEEFFETKKVVYVRLNES